MQWQLRNESALLKRFQYRTPNIRPIIDEVEGTSELLAIVLKHLDDDMLRASNARRLRRKEVKYVAKGVLDALKVLHEGGYAHTGEVSE
jgi:serine/threonine protein kinase